MKTPFTFLCNYSSKQVFEILQANKSKDSREFLDKMSKNLELKNVVAYICHVIVTFNRLEYPHAFPSIEDVKEVLNYKVVGNVKNFRVDVEKISRYYEDYGDPRNIPVLKDSKVISIESNKIDEIYFGEPNKHIYTEYTHLCTVKNNIYYDNYMTLSDRIEKMEIELAELKSAKEDIDKLYKDNNIDITTIKPRTLNRIIKQLDLKNIIEQKATKLYNMYIKFIGKNRGNH